MDCSVFGTVATIGDAWSWLVLREAVFDDIDRFDAFQGRLGVARATLSARLEHLTGGGVLDRERPRYVLSRRGADFFGCLMTAMAWGDRWYAGKAGPPRRVTHLGCGRPMSAELRCSHCRQALLARDVRYERRPAPADPGDAGGRRHRAPGLDLLERRSPSSIARTLRVMGDRWSGLVIREAFYGVRRFDDFHRQLAIATNVLADRLDRLVEHGVLGRVPYQHQPTRYEYRLTEKGLDLYPVIITLAQWGGKWGDLQLGAAIELQHRSCGAVVEPTLTCPECGEPVAARDMRALPGPAMLRVGGLDERA